MALKIILNSLEDRNEERSELLWIYSKDRPKVQYFDIKVGEYQNASDFVGHPILQTCPSWSETELRFSHQYFNIFIFHNSYKISYKPALRPSWSETELRFNISWVTPSPQNLALEILKLLGFVIARHKIYL